MTIKTKKKLIRYLVIPVVSLLILLFIGIAIVLNIVFTPEKLTPLATRLINENLDAKVRFDKIELTFFSSFPHFELHIKNGELLQKEGNGIVNRNDTLVSFASCDASINVRKLFFKEILDVKQAILVKPVIHFFMDEGGASNFDIIKQDTTGSSSGDGRFHLKKILIRNLDIQTAAIDFTDLSTGFAANAHDFNLKVKAADTPDKMRLKLESAIEKLNFTYSDINYLREYKTAMQADIVFDKTTRHLVFKQSALRLNDVDFLVDGDLVADKAAHTLEVDILAGLKVPSLHSLWQALPQEFTRTEDVDVSGKVRLQLTSKGLYGAGHLPVTMVDFSVENGAVAYRNFPGKINLLETKAKAYLDFASDSSSYIHIENFKLEGTGVKANASARIKQPLSAPDMHMLLKADINLAAMKQVFPLPDSLTLAGMAVLNLEASGDVKKVMNQDLNSLDWEGDIALRNIAVHAVKDSLHLDIQEAVVESHRDGIDKGAIKTTITALTADYKNQHQVNIAQGKMGIKRGKLTGNQTPLSARLSVEGMEYKNADNEIIAANKLGAGITLSSVDIKKMEAAGNVFFEALAVKAEADTIGMTIENGRLAFKKSVQDRMKADLKVKKVAADYKALHHIHIDSATIAVGKGRGTLQDARLKADASLLGMKYNNDIGDKVAAVNMALHAFITPGKTWATPAAITSTFTADSLYALHGKNFIGIRKGSYDIKLVHDTLAGWIPDGYVAFENMMAYSPELGMPVKLVQSKVSFDKQRIGLNNAHFLFGKSDIYLTGFVYNLFATDKQVTRGKLKLTGSYIDANELMTAMHKGQAFYDQTFTSTDEPEVVAEALPDSEKSVFALPKNLDLELATQLDHVLFGTLDLKDIEGKLEIKDGHLDLKGFHLKTLAADLDTKLRYEPVDDNNARIVFALDVTNIDMNNLHRLAPGMDTLMPMIKYFEGKAQFSVRGTGLVNEQLEVNPRSVKGFAAIKAKDIMVLDNETFRDLAKTLMFKSKEKNTVDVLDVEMLLDNSQMEILPAHIEIDRYQLAIGGLQNLDLSYDYHISVLKSPVPFKMGVDLKGDFDKYKISLARARYKFYFTDKKRLQEKADAAILQKKKFIQEKLNF